MTELPNIVAITVENPDEILNAGAYAAGAVIRLQTSATEAGVYADVSGTGSTPTIAVVAATRKYTGYDPAGTSSSWYRTRYENAGGTRTSDWSAVFQVGDEQAGMLCSLYDVQQELGQRPDAAEDETILEKIRQVSRAIERYTGRWLAPRPSSGTTTYRFHTEYGQVLHVPRGVRSVTTLGIADEDQAESGGTYTTLAPAYYWIDPPAAERLDGEAGLWVTLRPDAPQSFVDASFGAEVTGAFGPASVPPDIQAVAIRMAVRRYLGKDGIGLVTVDGRALPDMPPGDRAILDAVRRWVVA